MKALVYSISVPQWLALKALGLASKRLYYSGPLATIRLADLPEPQLPGPNWVKIKTLLCGFCASDLSLIFLKESPTGSPFTSFPCVIGHEVSGRIVEKGREVTELEMGDTITLCPSLNCRAREIEPPCRPCQAGLAANCENYARGNLAPGMFVGICRETGGGFAPYFVAHKSQCFKLPSGVSPEVGALIEPLSVGLQAVMNNPPQPDEEVLVIGGGVIGCMVIHAIRGLGLDCRISVLDPSAFAGENSRQAGADRVITDGDLFGHAILTTGAVRYKPMIGPHILMGGFARIYDTVGSSKTLNTAMRCLAAGGTLSQVGIHDQVKLDLTPLWLKHQTIKGVFGCGYAQYQGRPRHMFDIALDLVSGKKISLDGLVTHKFALEDFGRMIEVNLAKSRHKATKTAVSFM
ncbi:MAG: alcohol dehydrogenase catalytic domain-containing protein [Thermodesulfobacteriota bacterium]